MVRQKKANPIPMSERNRNKKKQIVKRTLHSEFSNELFRAAVQFLTLTYALQETYCFALNSKLTKAAMEENLSMMKAVGGAWEKFINKIGREDSYIPECLAAVSAYLPQKTPWNAVVLSLFKHIGPVIYDSYKLQANSFREQDWSSKEGSKKGLLWLDGQFDTFSEMCEKLTQGVADATTFSIVPEGQQSFFATSLQGLTYFVWKSEKEGREPLYVCRLVNRDTSGQDLMSNTISPREFFETPGDYLHISTRADMTESKFLVEEEVNRILGLRNEGKPTPLPPEEAALISPRIVNHEKWAIDHLLPPKDYRPFDGANFKGGGRITITSPMPGQDNFQHVGEG